MRFRRSTARLHTCMVALIILFCSTPSSWAAANAQGITQLSGTVVDTSGAVIAGATARVRSANGTVQITTHTDAYGSFIISGLSAGNYRLVVSSPGLETKEIPVTIGSTEAPVPLRISLAVSSVSTTINVKSREDSLLGIADSATQGTVGAAEIEDRPILRSGEILETIPGVIITQHAGGGKANQYFLRGFNLDHGTDFAIFIDDMPLNLPSHAHGEGYSDMNIVIPEFVERVNFEKGPYYADVGNYGSAGAADVVYFKTLPENFFQVEGGMYGYGRMVFGVSKKLRKDTLLYGGEVYHDNGPWTTHEDNFYKYNGLVTYSQGGEDNGFSITARAYRGTWHSSDQIPVDAIPLVGFFGALNPTDGGESQRYSLQAEWHRSSANSETKVTAYAFYYDLNLFSDFTYFLDDPIKGDQFEQQDRRWVAGFDAHHTIFSTWFGRKVANTFGLQLRNDWVHNGLFRTEDRMRTDKNDINACNDEPIPACVTNPNLTAILPADTDLNKFTDTVIGFYVGNKIQWAEKFRTVLAFRGDEAIYNVTSLTPSYVATELPGAPVVNFAKLNSGLATKFLPSPKASLIFGPWAKTEFYLQGGFSFHSNDARGATQRVEPISPDFPFPTSSTLISPLVQTKGGEVGVRTLIVPHLQSTLSIWYLHSNSELQQDGDTGGTVASEQSSNRYGVEWANYYTPLEHLAFDFDLADSRARFTQIDPADAAFSNVGGGQYPVQGPGGYRVPEAVGWVISSGVTVHDYKGFSSSLRLRYFGPRDLTSDGIYRSNLTALLNAQVRYQINRRWSISADFLNLLDRRDSDIDYAYISRITPTDTPAFTDVFHPTEPFQVRFALRYRFDLPR
ncbi:MAG: TonB-dependent receptor [Candidatus Acidiferrales bacterium]|jgi:carboxypeptidase family protein/TonB-dependent receptor-like protein